MSDVVAAKMGTFQLLSAPGASALSIWRLRGSLNALQSILPNGDWELQNQPQLITLRNTRGQRFDQGVLWLRQVGDKNNTTTCEVHLHGGHGPAAALRRHLMDSGWQEITSQAEGDASEFLCARGELNARWWALPQSLREQLNSLDSGNANQQWPFILQQPPHIVLAGPPNSGKSTMFNAWLQSDRVTVSPHPGTTRDAVVAPILIPTNQGRWQATLVDTAGIWASQESLDRKAIADSQLQLQRAWKTVWVFDVTREDWRDSLASIRSEDLIVLNKVDAAGEITVAEDLLPWDPVRISAQANGAEAVRLLQQRLTASLGRIPSVICT